MANATIMLKTANEIITPLFNDKFNANVKSIDFALSDLTTPPSEAQRDTQSTMAITNIDSGYTGSRDVYYNRVDATDLFYGIHKFLPFAVTELTPVNVVKHLNEHYGLPCVTIEHIESIVVDDDRVIVTFTTGSPIVTGSARFGYYDDAVDLASILPVDELGGLSTPGVEDGVPNATYYSYAFDMTYASAMVSGLSVGDKAIADLATVLAAVSGDPWILDTGTATEYNLANAELVFKGTSLNADTAKHPANKAYQNVAIFKLSPLCTNFGGYLLVNMNG